MSLRWLAVRRAPNDRSLVRICNYMIYIEYTCGGDDVTRTWRSTVDVDGSDRGEEYLTGKGGADDGVKPATLSPTETGLLRR